MEVRNKVWPHPCLLPDTSIIGLREILRCGHSISRHQSIYQVSHGNARFRDCIGGINVSCPWDALQNSPTIVIVVATSHKSLSLTGLVYLTPLPSVNSACLLLRLSYAPKQPPYWVGSGDKAPYLQAPNALLHSQPALLQRPWKVCIPSSAPTKSLAMSSLIALNLWTHLNHPWPTYNLMTTSSGMTIFVRNSPQHKLPFTHTSQSSSLVPLTSFGLWLMAPSPDVVLEPPFMLLARTAFSLPASSALNYASIRSHGYHVRSKRCL